MSSNYEMMYILRPDLSDEQVQQAVDKYIAFITDYKAEDIQIINRGKKRLAYLIGKHQDGIYIQMNYQADGKQVAPLERAMRLGEEVIRYLTIKLKDTKASVKAEVEVEEGGEEEEE
jgi:small subunit ribosomal protein S6